MVSLMVLGLPCCARERRAAYLQSGTINISGRTFSCSISLSCSLLKKKELPTHPDPFYESCLGPLWSQSLQSHIDRYVSGPVIASEWCALIAYKLLQHQFVWLSLEGGHRAASSVRDRKGLISREVLSASFPSISLDLILDESIQRWQERCPLLKRSVFTHLQI